MKWLNVTAAMAMLGTLLMVNSVALAVPSAEFRYVETDLQNGSWRYDYTLYNSADPLTDAGFNLFDAMITFDANATYTGVSTPTGCDNFAGSGFTQILSQLPGIPQDGGTDLAPGGSLTGLSFILDYHAGNLGFDAYFSNPSGPDGFPVLYTGTTSPEATVSPVPEPSTLFLIGAGLAGLWGYRQRRTQH